jgi:hypothetical protein
LTAAELLAVSPAPAAAAAAAALDFLPAAESAAGQAWQHCFTPKQNSKRAACSLMPVLIEFWISGF